MPPAGRVWLAWGYAMADKIEAAKSAAESADVWSSIGKGLLAKAWEIGSGLLLIAFLALWRWTVSPWRFGFKHRNEIADLEAALAKTGSARALAVLAEEVASMPMSIPELKDLAQRVASMPIEKKLRPVVRFVGINGDVLSFRPHVQSLVDQKISVASMDFEVLLPGVVNNPIRITGPACTIEPRCEWTAVQEVEKTLPQAVVAAIRTAHTDPKSNRSIGHEFPVHVRIVSITLHGGDAKEVMTESAIGTLVGRVQEASA